MTHSKYQANINDIDYINEIFLKVLMEIGKMRLHIISTYAPDMNRSRKLRRQFYEDLQNVKDSMSKEDHINIIVDLNARISDGPLPGVK